MSENDCKEHKKEVGGISDMEVLAGMIGDLHYEALTLLFVHLKEKITADSFKDKDAGRIKIANSLWEASDHIELAAHHFNDCWQISKPFMKK